MTSEPKAFASLSSGLLARKGAARPAMRPQGFGQSTGGLDDLGWNDMGFEPPKPSSNPLRDVHALDDAAPRVPFGGLTPLESPVHTQQAELIDRLSGPADENEFENEAESFDEATDQQQIIAEITPAQVPAYEPPVAEMIPVPPVKVVAPKAAPVQAAPRRSPKARSAPGTGAKAAFTLRLDPDRHLKLRLACAVGGRSAQQIVTDALDQMLAAMPELDAMADKAKRKGL